jgi:hypothetical protein
VSCPQYVHLYSIAALYTSSVVVVALDFCRIVCRFSLTACPVEYVSAVNGKPQLEHVDDIAPRGKALRSPAAIVIATRPRVAANGSDTEAKYPAASYKKLDLCARGIDDVCFLPGPLNDCGAILVMLVCKWRNLDHLQSNQKHVWWVLLSCETTFQYFVLLFIFACWPNGMRKQFVDFHPSSSRTGRLSQI